MNRIHPLTERQEYLIGGYVELSCARCAAQVRVRKSSPQQTSVQWSSRATRQCPALTSDEQLQTPAPTCPDLRRSIQHAVRTGSLGVT
ncbi:hypothetical protein [Salinispora cortesiana]|uniref:hypothetical protein n=1 Tax=Salinispora cortesiana TaxID=1305843 RepID=UPI00041FE798|nr:hypothetical protein [Salinispora cortesiana]